MCKYFNFKEMSEFLSCHIKEIEELKDSLTREYFSENAEENFEVRDLFKRYNETLKSYLNNLKQTKGKAGRFPFVIIGSIVEVQDMDDKETYQYRIALPYEKNTDMSIDCASCLSPLGKALLLKGIEQQVDIRIPTATLHYIIKDITIPGDLIAKYSKKPETKDFIHPTNTGLSI